MTPKTTFIQKGRWYEFSRPHPCSWVFAAIASGRAANNSLTSAELKRRIPRLAGQRITLETIRWRRGAAVSQAAIASDTAIKEARRTTTSLLISFPFRRQNQRAALCSRPVNGSAPPWIGLSSHVYQRGFKGCSAHGKGIRKSRVTAFLEVLLPGCHRV